jgi:hypothetical protein
LQIRSSRAGTVVRCRIGPLASDSLAYA